MIDSIPYTHAGVTRWEMTKRAQHLCPSVLQEIADWCDATPKTHEANPMETLRLAIVGVLECQKEEHEIGT